MQVIFLRKRFLVWLVLVCLVCVMIISFTYGQEKKKRAAIEAMSWAIAGRTILIDPGHGGGSGKLVRRGFEKDINLAVAKIVCFIAPRMRRYLSDAYGR